MSTFLSSGWGKWRDRGSSAPGAVDAAATAAGDVEAAGAAAAASGAADAAAAEPRAQSAGGRLFSGFGRSKQAAAEPAAAAADAKAVSPPPPPPAQAPSPPPPQPHAAQQHQPQPARRGTAPSAAAPPPAGDDAPGLGERIYAAKEASASALSVFALVLWTTAVTAWTAFQVVQNALWYRDIAGLHLGETPLPAQIGTQSEASVGLEERGLWGVLSVEAALTVSFFALAASLLWVPYIHSCRGGSRPRRTKRSFLPWACTLLLVAAAWCKLFALTSLMNKLSAYGLWCSANSKYLDLKLAFSGKPQPPTPGCTPVWFSAALRRTIVYALLSIAFHMLMWFARQPRSMVGKAFGLVPVVLIVAGLTVVPVVSLMNWYYTQGHFTDRKNFTFTSEMIVALIAFLTSVYLSVYMGWAVHAIRLVPRFTNSLLACCGRKYRDVYYEHEKAELDADARRTGRVSYSLRAAVRGLVQQWYYMTQLPAVFGFVSPMITYFALREQNWWVRADIIAGAAVLALYMLMCAFHRQLLAPPKAAA